MPATQPHGAFSNRPSDARGWYFSHHRGTIFAGLTSHPTDDGFHEIQLNGKQLVFLFMAATVVSVVIFLCGVLVGRGVRAEQAVADAALVDVPMAEQTTGSSALSGPDPRTAAPPTTVGDLSYAERLGKPDQGLDELKPPHPSRRSPKRDRSLESPIRRRQTHRLCQSLRRPRPFRPPPNRRRSRRPRLRRQLRRSGPRRHRQPPARNPGTSFSSPRSTRAARPTPW